MKFTVDNDNNLVLSVDLEEQTELQRAQAEDPDFDSDSYMHDLMEGLVCNSELDWVRPEQIGALTSAPILGVYADDPEEGKVREAWAFMDYQVTSPQRELAETGRAIFVDGMGPVNDLTNAAEAAIELIEAHNRWDTATGKPEGVCQPALVVVARSEGH